MRIVFDLDGTLADITHRLHYIQRDTKKDWPAFFQACDKDTPIQPMVDLARLLDATETVEIWSGRSDVVRDKTTKWLFGIGLGYCHLVMRREGDHRVDHEVKAEWLRNTHRDLWPDLVFDDRQQVVDMWRAHGIRCCQVAPGDF